MPIYKGCQPQREVGDFDLYRPRASFGRWYDKPTYLGLDFARVVSRRLGARKEVMSAVAETIDTLAKRFAEFVVCAETQGLFSAGLNELLEAYDALLRTAAEHLTNAQEVTYGFCVLNQAWMIGAESFDDWAVTPLLHPLKLLWWHNRTCHFNALIAALLAPDSAVSIVDETRFRRELPRDYSSAGFPVVLSLPGRDRTDYFIPLDEVAGYELYRPVTAAVAALGLDVELVTEQEGITAAQIAARHLAQVVEDYVETYPFVEDGIEVYLVQCRNGALPGQLVEQLEVIQRKRGWSVRMSVVVHTTNRGVPIFRRVNEWLAIHEEYQERPAEAYFPRVTLKVLETNFDGLLDYIQGKDLVILADVLSECGQRIDGRPSNAADDIPWTQFMPSYRPQQTPFRRGDLRRRQLLNSSQQPAVVRRFYNAQYAGVHEQAVPAEATIHFYEINSLHNWEQLLEKLHRTFNWVVCYDTAVDRFLLEHTFPGTVQVIRYSLGLGAKRSHNLTVSSAAGTRRAVVRRLKGRLDEILPTMSNDFRETIAHKLVEEANDISGDIVLRAAGPGAFLNELIGLVLTKHLTERRYLEAHPEALTAWIYLDDFSHWFSGKYPDLVFVAVPPDGGNKLSLHIEVIEAKCIADENFVREAEDAERQVAQGLSHLARAWMPRSAQGIGHLDAPYWYDQLNRAAVANLSIEGEQEHVWQLLRQSVEEGSFDLEISGHAWTFCHDSQGIVPSGQSHIEGESELTGIEAADGRLSYHRFARAGLLQALRDLVEEAWHIETPVGTWDAIPGTALPTTTEARRESPSASGACEVLPPSELANRATSEGGPPSAPTMEFDREWCAQRARGLGRILYQYNISANPVDPDLADAGPSVVRFKVDLKSGEKLSRLQNIAQDLARELALERAPLIANVPGTRYVGIDLPRPERVNLPLFPALDQLLRASTSSLPFLIGQTPDGRTIVRDLAQLPHLLVAGTTGSGKTMFLYTLLVSLLYQRGVESLSLILIDPKQTDFVFFERLPHLYGGRVFIEPETAIAQLEQLMTSELPHRTTVLREARCRDIHDYNTAHPHAPMRPIVVMIDEYADLLDVMGKSERDGFEKGLRRLAQQARNRGLHLVIATQRPSADIVTTSLKANLPARIAFHLPSWHDSRTILDQSGAETLLGKGDMLFTADGQMERLQGFYLSTAQLDDFLGRLGPSRRNR